MYSKRNAETVNGREQRISNARMVAQPYLQLVGTVVKWGVFAQSKKVDGRL